MTCTLDDFAIEAGAASIYVAAGFEIAAKRNREQYETCADHYGGHIGVMLHIATFGVAIEKYLQSLGPDFEFDGVFHYEYTEPMGKWFFGNYEATVEVFMAELQRIHTLSRVTTRLTGKDTILAPEGTT